MAECASARAEASCPAATTITRRQPVVRIVSLLGVLILGSSACATCPVNAFLLPGKRAFNDLKNRTALPSAADFDPRVTLAAMLAPGDDRGRWQQTRAAAIEGYVVRIHDADRESANCFSSTRVDTHIEIAQGLDAPPAQRVIVEVTPPLRDQMQAAGRDWSTAVLQREFTGAYVRVEGWLLFDDEHDEESENTGPGGRRNWRATAWEIHPVTSIELTARDGRDHQQNLHAAQVCRNSSKNSSAVTRRLVRPSSNADWQNTSTARRFFSNPCAWYVVPSRRAAPSTSSTSHGEL